MDIANNVTVPSHLNLGVLASTAMAVKGSPILNAPTCMKFYLFKQKWQFCKGD